jgi:hypothetical protein
MCSCLIWISCSLSRSSTLQRPPVTKSRLEPCNPAQAQPMCITSQPLSCDSDPAHRPTVARLTGIKRRVRTFRRLQLVCFQMDLRGDWSSTCPIPPPYPRRNQVGPRKKTHCRADCSATVNLLSGRSGRWGRFQAPLLQETARCLSISPANIRSNCSPSSTVSEPALKRAARSMA